MSRDRESRNRLLSVNSLYVDVEKDLREIAEDLSKTDADDLGWSLADLKLEFRNKDSESLYQKYRARLQHRFLVSLLLVNIFVYVVDLLVFTFFAISYDVSYIT